MKTNQETELTKTYVASCPVWNEMINDLQKRPKVQKLFEFLRAEKAAGKTIYPAMGNVYNAYKLTPFDKVVVALWGQDPYHDGSAHGLCFSTTGLYRPPSLRIIMQEIVDSYYPGANIDQCFRHNNLTSWAEQGILMLNTALTVEKASAGSHLNKGWEEFVTETIALLNYKEKPVIHLLWGAHAKKLRNYINPDHIILEADHPAAHLHQNNNANFKGSNHFALVNKYLKKIHESYKAPIGWAVLK
jgi:uracil-DNA glycosylase